MNERLAKESCPLLVPALTFGCCLLIVMLILVHFVWQLRYQALSESLSNTPSVFMEQNMPGSHAMPKRHVNVDCEPSLGHAPRNVMHNENSYHATAIDIELSRNEKNLFILREMFEEEVSHYDDDSLTTSGEKLLIEAGKGYLSADIEYRLDALIALKDMTGLPLNRTMTTIVFELIEETEDESLTREMLTLLSGSIDETNLAQLVPYLELGSPLVQSASYRLIAERFNEFYNNPTLSNEMDDVLDFISRHPEIVIGEEAP
ncbi:MAG: hypothetical protein MI867_06110 [Pseudomonadales bacterium]|nr:hypothetical protein [Pseudomonadales bacterium]